MSLLDKAIENVAEGVLKAAVNKAVTGFVGKGYITAAQAPEMEAGIIDEVQVGLEMWQASQARKE
jgi:hypothetical protein